MSIKWTYSWLLISISIVSSNGQISPGKLSAAHSHLEGISNCTQCHDLGNKVPDQKCLDCHSEIDNLIQSNRGFHVSSDVVARNCTECHNEHHGLKFEMVRFDEEAFDHAMAGYKLEGKHATVDCRACHQPDNIRDSKIRKKEDTFLGLGTACLDCHNDYHQKSLDNDCLQCHNFESFSPASKFDHSKSDFALVGAHNSVGCIECHPRSVKNGKDFQQFTDLAFNNCLDCHGDPHDGHLTGSCTQCHVETSFATFVGREKFDHNSTRFELKGSHQTVNCFECHVSTSNAKTVFQDRLNVPANNCIECHNDVHEGKFGFDCAKCHSEESFYSLKEMDFFDHSVTNFPLEGQHVGVDCKSCHTERLTAAIDFSACKNCHQDYHKGEFNVNGTGPDCKDCHIVEEKFTYTTYGFEEHNTSSFPLEGAHLATPCFACHVSEEHWTFRSIGQSCVDCHNDIHAGEIDASYYPEQDCTICHNTEQWRDVSFDHQRTEWALTGAHTEIDCRDCHFVKVENTANFNQRFTDLNQECIQCHNNVHGDQFAIENVTDCRRCHDTERWLPKNFDHNTTNFPLDGKHLEVDCRECHQNTIEVEGEPVVIFKIEKYECIDCHS